MSKRSDHDIYKTVIETTGVEHSNGAPNNTVENRNDKPSRIKTALGVLAASAAAFVGYKLISNLPMPEVPPANCIVDAADFSANREFEYPSTGTDAQQAVGEAKAVLAHLEFGPERANEELYGSFGSPYNSSIIVSSENEGVVTKALVEMPYPVFNTAVSTGAIATQQCMQ